jgi:cell wall-associated NlpC family hydrolase
MVAVPTHNHTKAGRIYGHVGIYVGNGIIRENIGIVKDTKLSDWISYYGSSAKWGFPY